MSYVLLCQVDLLEFLSALADPREFSCFSRGGSGFLLFFEPAVCVVFILFSPLRSGVAKAYVTSRAVEMK